MLKVLKKDEKWGEILGFLKYIEVVHVLCVFVESILNTNLKQGTGKYSLGGTAYRTDVTTYKMHNEMRYKATLGYHIYDKY